MQRQIRPAARTVILDKDGKIAVVEVKRGLYYKIPGGGVEDNETLEECALREAREEAGCKVEIIVDLGSSEFNSDSEVYGFEIHHSEGFLAMVIGEIGEPQLEDDEVGKKFRIIWMSFEDAIAAFENVKSDIEFELNMNNRDLSFVKKAQAYVAEHSNI